MNAKTTQTKTTVAGFQFSGMACGIKASGQKDLGIVVADEAVHAAAVFTKNLVRAAPVDVASQRIQASGGLVRAVLINSGSANAVTGDTGLRATQRSTQAVADILGVDVLLVLPASTGVIGVPLQADLVEKAAPALIQQLKPTCDAFADAILTTDRSPKIASTTFAIGRKKATVLGIAKGAGMIHPNMATTLGVVVTDAPVTRSFLKRALRRAVTATFNRISVDGDTSTNDTLVLMASGKCDVPALNGKGVASKRFQDALTDVLISLGKKIVADGEGAEHLVRIEVRGAPSDRAAQKIAATVATSTLVKTALHGCDPNWGRIMAAAGRAGVAFDPKKAELFIGNVLIFRHGVPVMTKKSEQAAVKVMQKEEYTLQIHLHAGRASGDYWTCDLGHEYIRINADYRS